MCDTLRYQPKGFSLLDNFMELRCWILSYLHYLICLIIAPIIPPNIKATECVSQCEIQLKIEASLFPELHCTFKRPGYSEFHLLSVLLSWLSCKHQQNKPFPVPSVLPVMAAWWPCIVGSAGGWSDWTRLSLGPLPDLPEASVKEDRLSIPHLLPQATRALPVWATPACIPSGGCPWAVTHCSRPVCSAAVQILGRHRGTLLASPQRAKIAQLLFVPLPFFRLMFVLQAERVGHHTWTEVLRFSEELALNKSLC